MSSKLDCLGAPVGQNIRLYKYGNMSICVSRSKEAGTPGVAPMPWPAEPGLLSGCCAV